MRFTAAIVIGTAAFALTGCGGTDTTTEAAPATTAPAANVPSSAPATTTATTATSAAAATGAADTPEAASCSVAYRITNVRGVPKPTVAQAETIVAAAEGVTDSAIVAERDKIVDRIEEYEDLGGAKGKHAPHYLGRVQGAVVSYTSACSLGHYIDLLAEDAYEAANG
ncbi:hypothetical protein [Actinoplanes sp. NBRC 101535]|uniref:hypothetical protein n=1 Tax=Actinoplanes sp. NBRC 101535 TaxID=3032196 RepID=UPI0024A0AE87|nr:hypothetical protein [Actinoplanes sp. NBRC 101535]GLY03075.1 hypothetical protein Acsp01_34540 [Actinoplanes sp. NBRC 101535]